MTTNSDLQVVADWIATHNAETQEKFRKELTAAQTQTARNERIPLAEWAHENYWIVNADGERQKVKLLPHQIAILEYALDPTNGFTTFVYSTLKKSGKTAIVAMIARWIAETWGYYNEIYALANDLEQAKGRIFKSAAQSIELTPGYDRLKRLLLPNWRILDKELQHLTSQSVIKSLSCDYAGEAGSNPTATLWTELWGVTSEKGKRLWEELTPVPTRAKSLRIVETYAGYSGESELLEDLYDLTVGFNEKERASRRIDLPGWPFDDPSPVYVNKAAGTIAYWDTGTVARRMPWQTPEYYTQQAQMLRPIAYDRLHNNLWGSSEESFCPIEWWEACEDLQLVNLNDDRTPVVIAADASVSRDSTAAVAVTRNPNNPGDVSIRAAIKFDPLPGGTIDYSKTIEPTLKAWCKRWNVVQIAYDPYQLHKMATDFTNEGIAWMKPFTQGVPRLKADKQLYDMIRDRRITYNGRAGNGTDMIKEHILGANAKISSDEDTRMRIVKKTAKSHIDLAVACSMAVEESLRLNI